MRVQRTLVLSLNQLHSETLAEQCVICDAETLEIVLCCQNPICTECLLHWAHESNTCPFCRRNIHRGADQRYANIDNPPPTFAEIVSEFIHQRVQEELSTPELPLNTTEIEFVLEVEIDMSTNELVIVVASVTLATIVLVGRIIFSL